MNLFNPLIIRRSRGHGWTYGSWLLAYLPVGWWAAQEIARDTGKNGKVLWLIPIAIVVAQMIYPTLFTWAIILTLSVLLNVVCLFYLAINVIHPSPLGYSQGGLIIGLIYNGLLIAVSTALIYARPRSRDSAV